jgi:hypothetical protein
MRCKHCGALLEAKGGKWQRLLHGNSQKIQCDHCRKQTAREEAEGFGTCYGAYAEKFEGNLMLHLQTLPEIKRVDAAKIMSTSQDILRDMAGASMLCSHVLHMFRPVVMEQARGRETEIAIVGVGNQIIGASGSSGASKDPQDGGEAAVVVLGQVEDANKNCVRQWEAMIARVGPARFVVHATACGDDPVGESSLQPSGNHADEGVTRARSSGEPTAALAPSHGSTPHVRDTLAH